MVWCLFIVILYITKMKRIHTSFVVVDVSIMDQRVHVSWISVFDMKREIGELVLKL